MGSWMGKSAAGASFFMQLSPLPKPAAAEMLVIEAGAAFLMKLVNSIADYFTQLGVSGVDPTSALETARDALIEHGMSGEQAANVVRMAIYRWGWAHGVKTYSERELRAVIDRACRFALPGAAGGCHGRSGQPERRHCPTAPLASSRTPRVSHTGYDQRQSQ